MFKEKLTLIFSFVFVIFLNLDTGSCAGNMTILVNGRICVEHTDLEEACIKQYFENIRPKFRRGHPPVNLPPLDPFFLSEIELFPNSSISAILRDLNVTGICSYNVISFKFNANTMKVDSIVDFPYITYSGKYDVNGKLLSTIPLRGKGPIKGNITRIRTRITYKLKFVEVKNETYLQIISGVGDYDFDDMMVKLEKLFPVKRLNDAVNALIERSRFQIMNFYKTVLSKVIIRIVIGIINGVTINVPFVEIIGKCFLCDKKKS